jgi:AcrR family transcriptional regulator
VTIVPNWKSISGSVYALEHTEPFLRLSSYDSGTGHMTTDTTPSGRPLRADARRNRERILDAARFACAEHGASVQMDDVARGAGVGVGTVYRHFPTKEALIEALVAEKYRVAAANAHAALEIEDPWESFADLMRRNAEMMARDATLRDALSRLGPDAVGAPEARAELEELGGRILSRAQEAGVLRDDVDIEDVGLLMSGLCASMSRPGPVWRRHLDLLLDGLRPPR